MVKTTAKYLFVVECGSASTYHRMRLQKTNVENDIKITRLLFVQYYDFKL